MIYVDNLHNETYDNFLCVSAISGFISLKHNLILDYGAPAILYKKLHTKGEVAAHAKICLFCMLIQPTLITIMQFPEIWI